jgi:hypothetical protein
MTYACVAALALGLFGTCWFCWVGSRLSVRVSEQQLTLKSARVSSSSEGRTSHYRER